MAEVDISLDAELVVEAVVRDCIARGHRTEARVQRQDETRRRADSAPPLPEG
ncbi:DUF2191 domain-containing protein [Streptomyces xanthophaeus]|uniref:DUF2191 domain-containing protein n=1 Tax=Streptomyces xanthophaeus TaxID=67385 RepID=UPI00264892DA|nr:DUF2191 domain-containing protein [Streptomyces xanthophaeus]WKD35798.1 DUF2191 domain-containing protein [Streptomyces xanthophaeus]